MCDTGAIRVMDEVVVRRQTEDGAVTGKPKQERPMYDFDVACDQPPKGFSPETPITEKDIGEFWKQMP